MNYTANTMTRVRRINNGDRAKIFELYKIVSQIPGGIARIENEITQGYIDTAMKCSANNGLQLVAEDPAGNNQLIGEIHCYKLGPSVFNHVLSELTIVVHPGFQSMGIGKKLFGALLEIVSNERPDILRIELIVRESNLKAIGFYQSLGFTIEGRLEKRIRGITGLLEADIPMAWFNASFKKVE